MLTGMGNGSVYFWEKEKCIKAVVGHVGSVSAICPQKKVKSFISGDKTGKIIVWNEKFEKEQEINIKDLNKNYSSFMVVALAQNSKNQLLIGTKSSHIYLMKMGDSIQKAKVVMSGHN
jgi:WD40 repeat protein